MKIMFLIQLHPLNVHCWNKFGINLTKYRNPYGGIMFHIKFPVIFSEDLDIFKCCLMKQNFEKKIYSQGFLCKPQYLAHFSSQFSRHRIL